MLLRDIRVRYRRSFLGFFWAFVPAIAATVALSSATSANIINVSFGCGDIPYPVYLICNLTLWQIFAQSVNGPVQALESSKPLFAKVYFPSESLVLAKLGEIFFDFSIRLAVVIAFFIWYKIPVAWTVIWTPLGLLSVVAFGTAIGLLIAPFCSFFQDLARALTFLLGAWMLATPVLYGMPKEGLGSVVMKWNPLTVLFVTMRELVITGRVTDPKSFGLVVCAACCMFVIGLILYCLSTPHVVER